MRESDSPLRPIWYMARGGIPIRAGSKDVPRDAAWWCREGDPAWTPIDLPLEPVQAPASSARPSPSGREDAR